MHRYPIENLTLSTRHKSYDIFQRAIFALAIMTLMPSCTTVFGGYGAKGQSKEDFVHYVEEVFRLQNKMTSELMLLSGNDEIAPLDASLSQAEQQMQTKCVHLNEYVSRDIDGLSTSLLLRKRVEISAMDCEKAAHVVEVLLKNAQP